MQRIWKKITSADTTSNVKNTDNDDTDSWSEAILSIGDRLPIYKIEQIASSDYNVPQILFNSISDEIDCVLLGESTHGTKEFYELRSIITKQLILNKGFTAIFIEMDWPKAYILNQYVLSETNCDINDVFNELKDYPLWMYRNNVIKELVFWLKNLNISLKNNGKEMINLYGIDMQSYDSLKKLKSIYKKNKSFLPNSTQILNLLNSIKISYKTLALNKVKNAYKLFLAQKDDIIKENNYKQDIVDLIYNIDQNFITLKSALKYFSNGCLWDIRDSHWFDSIEKYFYYKSNGKYLGYDQNESNDMDIDKGKIILWAHNSHIVNADFASYSHSNIGSFTKNKYGQNKVFTVSLDTFKGNVTASKHWDELPQFFNLNDNVKQSYGYLWHNLSETYIQCNQFVIFLKNGINKLNKELIEKHKPIFSVKIDDVKKKRKLRDIGVCYEDSNPYSHCSNGNILEIADVLIFINNSNALQPFDEDKDKNWDKRNTSWHQKHSKL